jgi:hypothetical protein
MVVQGLSVWKQATVGGILGDIDGGFFEPVQQYKVFHVWATLMQQDRLSSHETIHRNLVLSHKAWHQAGSCDAEDDEDSILVFGSDKDVAELADEALHRWIKVNLLDETQ